MWLSDNNCDKSYLSHLLKTRLCTFVHSGTCMLVLCWGCLGTSGYCICRTKVSVASLQTVLLWLHRVCHMPQPGVWGSWPQPSPLFSWCLQETRQRQRSWSTLLSLIICSFILANQSGMNFLVADVDFSPVWERRGDFRDSNTSLFSPHPGPSGNSVLSMWNKVLGVLQLQPQQCW